MRLFLAHFIDIEPGHVLDARVCERYPGEAARLDPEHRDVIWQPARQI